MATSDSILEYSFSFDILMDEIQRINQLRVKELFDKDNNIKFDNYAIKDSDDETVKIFVSNAVYDLVELTLPLMSGISNNIHTGNPYGVTIKNFGNANEAAKQGIENVFKQVMVASVLMQWYEMKGIDSEVKLWATNLERLKSQTVPKRLFQLKIRTIN